VDKLIDYVGVYDSILEPKLCRKLIELFEENDDSVKEQTTGNRIKNYLKRKGDEIDVSTNAEFVRKYSNIVLDGIFYTLEMYKKQTGDIHSVINNNSRECTLEKFRLRKYKQNDGFFSSHIDIGDYNTSMRFLVIIFYLNTVRKGGETTFTNLRTSVKPKEGRVLIFHPNFMFPHIANMPLSDHKYTLQTYLHYSGGSTIQD
jgi:hypothetical protein